MFSKLCEWEFIKMSSRIIFYVAIVLSMIVGSLGYQYFVPGEIAKSKDKDGFCYYDRVDKLIEMGKSEILTTCEEVSCGKDYLMTISGWD